MYNKSTTLWKEWYYDRLHRKMQFEMELRGFSKSTMKSYTSHAGLLLRYFKKSANQITPDEIKRYLYHRIKAGISYSNIDISCNAFKLLFNYVLRRNWSDDVIVRPKKLKKLPPVLSRDEILAILGNIENIKHRTILLTAYSSGLRISEVLNLRLEDIDSKGKTIKVRGGKGGKDRLTILGDENLAALRRYWKLYRPKDLLFPGLIEGQPVAARNIQYVFKQAKEKARITKPATVHTLRHYVECFVMWSDLILVPFLQAFIKITPHNNRFIICQASLASP